MKNDFYAKAEKELNSLLEKKAKELKKIDSDIRDMELKKQEAEDKMVLCTEKGSTEGYLKAKKEASDVESTIEMLEQFKVKTLDKDRLGDEKLKEIADAIDKHYEEITIASWSKLDEIYDELVDLGKQFNEDANEWNDLLSLANEASNKNIEIKRK